ncbi:TlpA disulfide reductase family protein [Methylotenera versatilis]|uniref:TlpA disulfide reductase family protein n=1 Tax=Methylotenera versatilis TaxID=1055487 RepID=UPI0006475098
MLGKKAFLFVLMIAFFGMSLSVYSVERSQGKGFVLSDTNGKKHALSQYKGKWVIVNYWATWCPPCLEEVPDLVALYDSRKNNDVMLLGVSFDYQDAKEVADYVDDMLISYPIVLGDDDVIRQIGSAEVMPTTFIYNPRGVLVRTKRGLVTKAYLEDFIANETLKKH